MSQSDLTAEERLERMERALEWLQADVALAVRGMQALLQLHGINGQLKVAFARWEAAMDERYEGSRDEPTSPGDRPGNTMPSPPPSEAE